jgi:hypothetical protein
VADLYVPSCTILTIFQFRPCSTDDTVESLLATESFEEALQFAKDNATSLRRTTVHDVGKALLDALIARRELIKAAKMCPEVGGGGSVNYCYSVLCL